jgi:hypothetical protein
MSEFKKEYELLLVDLRERAVHAEGDGVRDFVCGVFLSELLANIVKENEGGLEFERTISEADEEQISVLVDVIDISAWGDVYS